MQIQHPLHNVTKPIRWGILGTGTVARDFATGLNSVKGCTIRAVGSRDIERAQDFARRHNVPTAAGSYDAVARDASVDVVYIATPHHRHKADCLLCLGNGKAVLCEKPFALNAEDALSVVEQARAENLFCMEAMWTRFLPVIQRMKGMIDGGRIGEVRMLTADFSIASEYDPDGRLFNPQLGGGALLDRGVYGVSLATWLFGDPVDVVCQGCLGASDVDEQVAIILRHPGNRLAVLTAAINCTGTLEATVFGSHGTVRMPRPFVRPDGFAISACQPALPCDNTSTTASIFKTLKQYAGKMRWVRHLNSLAARAGYETAAWSGNGYNYEAQEVVRCLSAGLVESPVMPLAESLSVMRTMDTVRNQLGLRYPLESHQSSNTGLR